jgi:PAS domain S-box-containing protein/diguanylate cyclase (GGDEF)-like protein
VKKIALFFLPFFALLLFFFYYLHYAKEKVTNLNLVDNHITELSLHSKNIDSFLNENLSYINQDIVVLDIQSIQNILQKLLNNSEFLFLKDSKIVYQKLDELAKVYDQEIKYLEKYRSRKAVLNNSIRYITTLVDNSMASHTNNVNDEIYLSKANTIFLTIIELSMTKEVLNTNEINLMIKDISQIKNLSLNLENSKMMFTMHVNKFVEIYGVLTDMKTKIDALDRSQKIENFRVDVDNYLDTVFYNIYFIVSLLFMFIIIFVVIMSYFAVRHAKDKTTLEKFENVVSSSDNSIIIADKNMTIQYVNRAFERITGRSKESVIGKNSAILEIDLNTQELYDEIKSAVLHGKTWSGELVNYNKNQDLIYEKVSIKPLYDEKNQLDGYLAIKLDITKDKEYQKEIEIKNEEITKKHYIDNLTSVPNRNALLERINNQQGVVLLLNIDSFKHINDYYGMEIGDQILVKFASLLEKIKNGFGFSDLFRVHTDEFCLYSPNRSLIKDLEEKIYSMINMIENNQFCIDDVCINVNATIGGSFSDKPSKEMELLTYADLALKHARREKISFSIFSESNKLQEEYHASLKYAQILKDAIANNRVVPYFQPIIDANTSKIYSYESLIRVIDTEGTVLSPYLFLNIAKEQKLYSKLTNIMITKSFDFFKNRDLRFSVNLSYEDIVDQYTTSFIYESIEKFKYKQNIGFEILETESIKDYDVILNFIKNVKNYGCSIYIDDFGSGYSNFERLFRFNSDVIKIDGSIIRNIDKNEESKIIAETIVSFAKKSKIKVVAEFVHSIAVANIVKELGVDYLQGFLYSEPISAQKLELSL